ncbi:uncharacterized protein [Periplaneta americana]|uniref:uncharacterized protein n=1 Tax=Periplaneta americana TaxID=6978 RepID=UPI0037E766FE
MVSMAIRFTIVVLATVMLVVTAEEECTLAAAGAKCETGSVCCSGCCNAGVCADDGKCYDECSSPQDNGLLCNSTVAIQALVDGAGTCVTDILGIVYPLINEIVDLVKKSLGDPLAALANTAKIMDVVQKLAGLTNLSACKSVYTWFPKTMAYVIALVSSLH